MGQALLHWEGRKLIETFFWSLDSADATYFCDACPVGLGLWVPNTNEGFVHTLPAPSRDIYLAEFASVVAGITLAHSRKAHRIVIFTDSENVVDLFSSHRAIDLVRKLFKTAVNIMLLANVDVKVKHVPGDRNVIADLLSRSNLDLVRTKVPKISIRAMSPLPPRLDGGIRKTLNKNQRTK